MKYLILFLLIIAHLQSQSINYEYRITWSEPVTGVNTAINCITTDPYNLVAIYACGKNGVVLKSSIMGTEWTNVGVNGIPPNIELNTIGTITPNIVVTAGNIGNTTYVYRSDNGGSNWNLVFTQDDGRINAIALWYNYRSFLVGNPVGGRWSIWKSVNTGQSWDSAGLYLPQNENESGFINSFSRGYDMDILAFGTNNHRVYYSANSGTNWETLFLPDESIHSINIRGRNFICGGDNLYTSSDYGHVWSREVSPGTGSINGINFPDISYIIPADNFLGYPAFLIRNGNNIYYTENVGSSDWEIKYSSARGN